MQPVNVTTEQCDGSNILKIINTLGYKTDDEGGITDLTAPVCKRCYRPKSCCHRDTSNVFKHLSLAPPDPFRELRDRQVSAFRFNLN